MGGLLGLFGADRVWCWAALDLGIDVQICRIGIHRVGALRSNEKLSKML